MPKEITAEEARAIIDEYPDVEYFIEAKFQQYMGGHNEYSDNSIELDDYWHKCKKISELSKPQT